MTMAFHVGLLILSGLLPERQRRRIVVFIHIIAWRLVIDNLFQVHEINGSSWGMIRECVAERDLELAPVVLIGSFIGAPVSVMKRANCCHLD
jgi:hypothetical protein